MPIDHVVLSWHIIQLGRLEGCHYPVAIQGTHFMRHRWNHAAWSHIWYKAANVPALVGTGQLSHALYGETQQTATQNAAGKGLAPLTIHM